MASTVQIRPMIRAGSRPQSIPPVLGVRMGPTSSDRGKITLFRDRINGGKIYFSAPLFSPSRITIAAVNGRVLYDKILDKGVKAIAAGGVFENVVLIVRVQALTTTSSAAQAVVLP